MRKEQLGVGVLFRSGAENSDGIMVDERDSNEFVTLCHGTIAAPSAKAGYRVGAQYVNTSTGTLSTNVGTTASCVFREGPVYTDDVTGTKYTIIVSDGIIGKQEV